MSRMTVNPTCSDGFDFDALEVRDFDGKSY